MAQSCTEIASVTSNRRDVLRLLTATAATGIVPQVTRAQARQDLYEVKPFGNVRVLHQTDTHAQVEPVLFREPSANIGIGPEVGNPPHIVGDAFLKLFGMKPNTRDAYAFTYLDFEEAAHRYGRLGGFAHIKPLLDRLRTPNAVVLDGGDLWQGTGLANIMQGADMVELGNMLGLDVMTAHWEFTYGEAQLRKNLGTFKGDFIAQNVFLTDEAAFNGAPSFDSTSGRVFRPYVMKALGGHRIAVIGQAFPYQPIAHPRRLVENWTFGIREAELQKVVDTVRDHERADAVILLSHNGMDVDLKLASRVRGIDVILGGHTHDAMPTPSTVINPGGKTLVTNGGSNGKFVAVLDLDVSKGRVNDVRYTLLPVFTNLLPADPVVAQRIEELKAPHRAIFAEKLAPVGEVLYRRGNFIGTMDQLIGDALRQSLNAQIALSPGFRWGTSLVTGDAITMGDLLAQTAITYPDVYVQDMTGAQLKGIMEDVCDNLFNPDPYLRQGGDMVRVTGVDYACVPAAAMGRRISDLTLDDGTKVEADKTYRVAGWASVVLPQTGKPVWEVVAGWLKRQGTAKPARLNKVLVKGINGNPGYVATA